MRARWYKRIRITALSNTSKSQLSTIDQILNTEDSLSSKAAASGMASPSCPRPREDHRSHRARKQLPAVWHQHCGLDRMKATDLIEHDTENGGVIFSSTTSWCSTAYKLSICYFWSWQKAFRNWMGYVCYPAVRFMLSNCQKNCCSLVVVFIWSPNLT